MQCSNYSLAPISVTNTTHLLTRVCLAFATPHRLDPSPTRQRRTHTTRCPFALQQRCSTKAMSWASFCLVTARSTRHTTLGFEVRAQAATHRWAHIACPADLCPLDTISERGVEAVVSAHVDVRAALYLCNCLRGGLLCAFHCCAAHATM